MSYFRRRLSDWGMERRNYVRGVWNAGGEWERTVREGRRGRRERSWEGRANEATWAGTWSEGGKQLVASPWTDVITDIMSNKTQVWWLWYRFIHQDPSLASGVRWRGFVWCNRNNHQIVQDLSCNPPFLTATYLFLRDRHPGYRATDDRKKIVNYSRTAANFSSVSRSPERCAIIYVEWKRGYQTTKLSDSDNNVIAPSRPICMISCPFLQNRD